MNDPIIELDVTSPTGIKGVKEVHLPAVYQRARAELAKVTKINEASEWASKAEALAAYAKMQNDREMEKTWKAIREWAVRRYGQLRLLIVNPRGRPPKINGTDSAPIKTKANKQKKQNVRASRYAAIPEQDFERLVDQGASSSAIEKAGTKSKPKPPEASPEYKMATALLNLIEYTQSKRKAISVPKALMGMTPDERKQFAKDADALCSWYADLAVRARLNRPAQQRECVSMKLTDKQKMKLKLLSSTHPNDDIVPLLRKHMPEVLVFESLRLEAVETLRAEARCLLAEADRQEAELKGRRP